ncbi:MAG: type 1 glutamine amidotransferase [candidate division KSB1 bacterium]|nr:type 1 glutamine amidotransferase [candidate division KSB1 bacterium]MDZ7302656.1 type 1 glutamine amidotransferase [candidate division KSB1 bacterium]MDZ7311814.1 type 1 glutamine amidotransferase [candidate division KSB1 bacterium]
MNIHYFQHVWFEGPAGIEAWAAARGHQISATRFYAGDPIPRLERLDWLVIMGGPMSVHDEAQYPWLLEEKRFIAEAIKSDKSVIGICLGAQLVAHVLGARIYRNAHKEIGWFPVHKTPQANTSNIFKIFPAELEVFHWHGETFDLPAGVIHLARSAACENQAFIYDERVIGLQFHLETTRESASQLIENGRDELVAAPFIQTPENMLANQQRFDRINATMDSLLNRLELAQD